MTPVLERLDRSDVMILWSVLKPYFEAAIARGDSSLSPDDIRALALSGRRLIWTVTSDHHLLATFSSGTQSASTGMTAFIDFLGGEDMDDWLRPCLAQFEAHARHAGATAVEIVDARLGWQRKLAGYRPVRTTLRKDLIDG